MVEPRGVWTDARSGREWRDRGRVVLAGRVLVLCMAVAACTEGAAATAEPADGGVPPTTTVDALMERAERAQRLWRGVELYHEREIAPLERVLLRYRDDPELARRIAVSLVVEARRVKLDPRMLLAVLLVENPWLDPEATSPVGARGLMQVMPTHRGNWPPCPADLESVESNICHGASIFAHYLRLETGDVERALLRYNGCVHGTNTPDCHRYPTHVYARAGRASMLAWLEPRAGRTASP